MFSRVDFPQPEWPMIETYSPFSMPRLTSVSTWVGADPRLNDFEMRSTLKNEHYEHQVRLVALERQVTYLGRVVDAL